MPKYDVTISRAKWQWTTVRVDANDKDDARSIADRLPEHGMAWATEDHWEYADLDIEEVPGD